MPQARLPPNEATAEALNQMIALSGKIQAKRLGQRNALRLKEAVAQVLEHAHNPFIRRCVMNSSSETYGALIQHRKMLHELEIALGDPRLVSNVELLRERKAQYLAALNGLKIIFETVDVAASQGRLFQRPEK